MAFRAVRKDSQCLTEGFPALNECIYWISCLDRNKVAHAYKSEEKSYIHYRFFFKYGGFFVRISTLHLCVA